MKSPTQIKLWLLFLLLTALPSAAKAVCEADMLLRAPSTATIDQYDRDVELWTQEMIKVYQGRITRRFMPDSLTKTSRRAQLRTEIYLNKMGPTILEKTAALQQQISANPLGSQNMTLQALLESVQDEVRSQVARSKFDFIVSKGSLTHMEDVTNQALDESGAKQVSVKAIESFQRNYAADIARYKSEYGPEAAALFSSDAVRKAGFNNFAMNMIATISGYGLPDREAINAISLLHPITDDALDAGMDIRSSMGKVTELLQLKPVQAENAYERVVFDMIHKILAAYPPSEHPVVLRSLQRLHQEQLKSVRQKFGGMPESQMLDLTIRKGSYTSVLFGYLAIGHLNDSQVEYFYKAGAILQYIDDMLDFSADQKEGNLTIWTVAAQNKKSLKEPLKRMLQSQKYLESQGPRLLAGLKNAEQFNDAFNFGFKLFMISSMFYDELAPEFSKILANRLPISHKAMVRVVYSVLDHLQSVPKLHDELLSILDSGFLSGQYQARLDQGTGPLQQDLNVETPTTFWKTITFLDKLNVLRARVAYNYPRLPPDMKFWVNSYFVASAILIATHHTPEWLLATGSLSALAWMAHKLPRPPGGF